MPLTVGVVSSIPFIAGAHSPRAAFESGLGTGVTIVVKDAAGQGLGYDPVALAAAVNTLSRDAAIDLIVTVGGNITCVAAADRISNPGKPFISLVGGEAEGLPKVGVGNFKGAVSLETIAGNPTRAFKIFKRLSTNDPQQICLLYNSNSQMAGTEKSNTSDTPWLGQSQAVDVRPGVPPLYTNAFNAITTAQAVVVSADPWFFQTRTALIAAADIWAGATKWVCYPCREYLNAPATRRIMYGPHLERAYRRLGRMAKRWVNNVAAPADDDFDVQQSESVSPPPPPAPPSSSMSSEG